ncbi:MAG: arabinose operon transcriptional regulator AraC [Chloroflexi bacterium]|nr:arabinose operon transcriptional regulator AraC [Chloroflexota bacterium]
MLARRNTPSPRFSQILTGHYDRGYDTWRENGTGDWLLIFTEKGAGRFGHSAGAITTRAGDVVLIQPGTLHDYGAETPDCEWEILWAHFHPRPHWHEWMEWPREAPGLLRLRLEDPPMRRRIYARFQEAHRLASGALRRREPFAMNALEETLLWCDTQNPHSDQIRMDSRIRLAMDYLCAHLHQKITLQAVAAASGLSASRLAHLFRSQVGLTAQQFLEQQRLGRAIQLLELTPRTIQEIAYEVGYDNPFYFTLRFKRHTGLSPRDYRKKAQA